MFRICTGGVWRQAAVLSRLAMIGWLAVGSDPADGAFIAGANYSN